MRLFIAFILPPILTYAAATTQLRHEGITSLNELTDPSSLVGRVDYVSAYTSLPGVKVGLDNATTNPEMTDSEFQNDRVRITVPHIGHLINLGSILSGNKASESPNQQRISLRSLVRSKNKRVTAQAARKNVTNPNNPFLRVNTQPTGRNNGNQPDFHTVSVMDAHKYVGRKAKLSLHNGRAHEGIIEDVTEWRIKIAVKRHSGTMSYSVKLGDVVKLKVYY